jgi:protein-L-isoaspartate O-methyltransferase
MSLLTGRGGLWNRVARKLRNSLSSKDVSENKYQYSAADTVINDFAEFSGLSISAIVPRAANVQVASAQEWQALPGSFSEQAATFYGSSQNYIYDLVVDNANPKAVIQKLNRFNPRIMESIRTHPGKRFLEFGGGVGVFCGIVAELGKEVHYLDLPSIAFDFARWRFNKLGLKISMIEANAGTIEIPGLFDIIYTDAVLEHLPQNLQAEATTALARAVAPGGVLLYLVDLSGPTAKFPMHHVVDIAGLHSILDSEGLRCETGRRTFCSIWRRS